MFRAFQIVSQNVFQRSTDERLQIGRFLQLTACHGDGAGEIHVSQAQEAADEDHRLGANGPNDFSLIDGIDLVDLYADIARRIGTFKDIDTRFADGEQRRVHLLGRDAEVHLGDASQESDSLFEIFFLTGASHIEVGCQRHFVECRNENGFRRV